jgi:hypothetical protein
MPTVTQINVARRPRSASIALSGIVAAKKTIPTSWMTRNVARL